jgi:hypothetical protein
MRAYIDRKILFWRLSLALSALRLAQVIAPRRSVYGVVIRRGVSITAAAFALALNAKDDTSCS